jgi:hypothetical protein
MTARDDLVAHPHAFIRHNLLSCSLIDPTPAQIQPDGTVLLKLEDYTTYYNAPTCVRNRKLVPKLYNYITDTVDTKLTNVYVVTAAIPGDHDTFSAYICPYET